METVASEKVVSRLVVDRDISFEGRDKFKIPSLQPHGFSPSSYRSMRVDIVLEVPKNKVTDALQLKSNPCCSFLDGKID